MYDELIIKYEFLKKLVSEEELEEEYGVIGYVSKGETITKIIKLNCDRNKIIEWIENTLINDI